ncbi:rRNA pseudouridine synthase [Candidatus Woesearchaeota archaeon]|nr:MAG: rRNA pseudouridine synthase [Candidatus Woesearchaeota archaeon]
MNKERLQKILAKAGIASRRACEKIIEEGRVRVNGSVAKIGDSATAEDVITVDGKRIKPEKPVTLALNKPKGYVTTVKEKHGMRTVMELIPVKERVYPIGRLDKDTQGLLLFTNDGNLANKLMHPRYGVEKTYVAKLDKQLQKKEKKKLKEGILVEGRKVKARVRAENNIATITIHEGRKHIVKRLFAKIGYKVKNLKRIAIGPIKLKNLPLGKTRRLTEQEIKSLLAD